MATRDPGPLVEAFRAFRVTGGTDSDAANAIATEFLPDIVDMAREREGYLDPDHEVSDLIHAGFLGLREALPRLRETEAETFVAACLNAVEIAILTEMESHAGRPSEQVDPGQPSPGIPGFSSADPPAGSDDPTPS